MAFSKNMKLIKLIILIVSLSTIVSWGTGTRRDTVHIPTHVLFVDEGGEGGVTEVHCVMSGRDLFEGRISLLNKPYIPLHDNWNNPADTNLITLYGMKVSLSYDIKGDPKKSQLIITIDCSNSLKPKGYPFTVTEVVEKVKACVKLNCTPKKIIVIPNKNKENNSCHTTSYKAL